MLVQESWSRLDFSSLSDIIYIIGIVNIIVSIILVNEISNIYVSLLQ